MASNVELRVEQSAVNLVKNDPTSKWGIREVKIGAGSAAVATAIIGVVATALFKTAPLWTLFLMASGPIGWAVAAGVAVGFIAAVAMISLLASDVFAGTISGDVKEQVPAPLTREAASPIEKTLSTVDIVRSDYSLSKEKKDFLLSKLEAHFVLLHELDKKSIERDRLENRLEEIEKSGNREEIDKLKREKEELKKEIGEEESYKKGEALAIGEDTVSGINGRVKNSENEITGRYPDYRVIRDYAKARTLTYIQRDTMLAAEGLQVSSVDKSNTGEIQWIIEGLKANKFRVDSNGKFIDNILDFNIVDASKPLERNDSMSTLQNSVSSIDKIR